MGSAALVLDGATVALFWPKNDEVFSLTSDVPQDARHQARGGEAFRKQPKVWFVDFFGSTPWTGVAMQRGLEGVQMGWHTWVGIVDQ